jgi:hypothetical protein
MCVCVYFEIIPPAGRSAMHWPVMFLYPEYSQSDLVADVGEPDTLASHLAEMFPAGGAPHVPWDSRGDYAAPALAVHVPGHGPSAGKWLRIDTALALGDVLRQPGIAIPGMPIFPVFVAGSEAERVFLADAPDA